jgi:D-alanine-D-alanine ligase
LRIGIAFDLAPEIRDLEGPDDRYEEFDKPQTIEALARVLRGEGHDVVFLGDGREFLSKVLADPPDLVWNLAEGEGVGRCREARVPAVLEMLGIPYTGSDPLTLSVALDKDAAKRLLGGGSVEIPRGVAIPAGWTLEQVDACLEDSFFGVPCDTWIVKPAFEGSSKGIRAQSLADSREDAVALVARLALDYRQPILVEEFIAGDEVTVGLIGNGEDTEILGAMRIRPKVRNDRFIYSLEVKRDWDERVAYETPAQLPECVTDRLNRSALAAYATLGCRDLARIDFRIRDGIPYFIEANPLPGLAPDWSDLVILARGMGVEYADLIRRVLDAALVRVGMIESPRRGARR